MRQVLRLAGELGVVMTSDLTEEFAIGYVSARLRAVSACSVRGEISYLQAAMTEAHDKGFLDRLPKWRQIRPPRGPRRRKVLHSIEDIGRVLESLHGRAGTWDGARLYMLASFLAHTGVRRGEALYGQVGDIDRELRVFHVVGRIRLKTEAARRVVPLPPDLLEDLDWWIPQTGSPYLFPHVGKTGPWTSGGPGRKPTERLRAAGAGVGVEGFTCQSLRHSFATWGRRRFGVGSVVMRDVLGHTSVETHQDHYLHSEELAELVAAVRCVSYRAVPARAAELRYTYSAATG